MINNILDNITKQRIAMSAKVDEMIIDRLLIYTDNLDNYVAVFYDQTDGGYFELDCKKVLRWSKRFESNLRDTFKNINEISWTFSYEVFDYNAQEYLYLEEK